MINTQNVGSICIGVFSKMILSIPAALALNNTINWEAITDNTSMLILLNSMRQERPLLNLSKSHTTLIHIPLIMFLSDSVPLFQKQIGIASKITMVGMLQTMV